MESDAEPSAGGKKPRQPRVHKPLPTVEHIAAAVGRSKVGSPRAMGSGYRVYTVLCYASCGLCVHRDIIRDHTQKFPGPKPYNLNVTGALSMRSVQCPVVGTSGNQYIWDSLILS